MRLIHPNIVRVLECAQAEDGSPFLVMELLDGVPLGAYTAERRARAARAGRAHPPGNPRRASRPRTRRASSIATSSRTTSSSRATPGGTFVVKVLDFGIAKVMDVAGGMGSSHAHGRCSSGTPAYMSPEQAQERAGRRPARRPLERRGAVLRDADRALGVPRADRVRASRRAARPSEPEPVEQIDPALAPLAPFFARALKKDRNERFAPAREMARALAARRARHRRARPRGRRIPLSRLPDVPSVFGPPGGSPPAAAEPAWPRESARPGAGLAATSSRCRAGPPAGRARRAARSRVPPRPAGRRAARVDVALRRAKARSARRCRPRTPIASGRGSGSAAARPRRGRSCR